MLIVLICVFLLLSVILKNPKWRKRFFWTAFGMLFFFSNDFIANEAMRAWEIEATPFSEVRKYKLGIVLTGVTSGFREPADRVYFQRGADRVTHTLQLYKEGFIDKILISGGSGRLVDVEIREADQLKKAFMLMGVPEEDMMIENQSRNTYESAEEVKKILGDSIRADDCVLITSSFHMRRSRACFKKAGIPMETFSTDFYAHPRYFYLDTLLVPSLDALVLWQKLIKEWVGFAAYWAAGHV